MGSHKRRHSKNRLSRSPSRKRAKMSSKDRRRDREEDSSGSSPRRSRSGTRRSGTRRGRRSKPSTGPSRRTVKDKRRSRSVERRSRSRYTRRSRRSRSGSGSSLRIQSLRTYTPPLTHTHNKRTIPVNPNVMPEPSVGDDRQNNLNNNLANPCSDKSMSQLFNNIWTHGFTANMNVIPEFNPSDKSQNIDTWLHKVNECAKIYGWNEQQTCHYALPKLSGLAKLWYTGLPSLLFGWDEWMTKLRSAFPSNENYGELLSKMLQLRCRMGQPLDVYYYEKMALINRCEISGRKAVGCVVHGIDDKFIRMSVSACRFEEPDQLFSYLRTLAQNDGSYSKRISFSNRDIKPVLNRQPQSDINANKSVPVCYGCGEPGHIRPKCPKCPKMMRKCNICAKEGHLARDCRSRFLALPAVSESAIPTSQSTLQQSTHTINKILCVHVDKRDSEKYYKDIKINGIHKRAFIDFGSNCTLIRHSDANEVLKGWTMTDELPNLRGFGNSSVKPLGVSRALITIDGVEAEVEVVIVPNQVMQNALIIGQTFTELPNIVVHKTSESLIFYEAPYLPVERISKNNIIVAADVSVDSLVTMSIEVKVEDFQGSLYLPGSHCVEPNRQYVVLPGLYHFENGIGFVMITNISTEKIKFSRNNIIARGFDYMETSTPLVSRIESQDKPMLPLPLDNLRIGAQLDQQQKSRFDCLLLKYRDCFALDMSELGKTNLSEMKIRLLDDVPVVYNPYRMSMKEREQLSKIIDELLSNGIVRPSSSSYASPVILVNKKNGQKRLCVDYRALNRKTMKDKYPLPRIEDKLDCLGGNKYFSSLDLASGYYQVPVAEESKHLTAFITPDGLYEYNRMPFGLANAPSVFQRVVNVMLKGTNNNNHVLAYMDDLLVPSKSIEDGLDRLEEVFIMLRNAKLTLNIEKCTFFQEEVEYLGYQISEQGIRPGVHKIEAVQKFPVPKNVHEVRQFVGLASYFRRFVKDFSIIARPLTVLTKKNEPWTFGEEQIRAFNSLKQKLISRPVLTLYNPDARLEVHTDASKLGIGAILLQDDGKGLQPISYYSRQTTVEEQKFHSYELETLAVVTALNRFRVYLLGTQFKLVTDCNAVRNTMTKKDLIPRVARWYIAMQEYDFVIEYRAGIKMSHVDALSRMPVGTEAPLLYDDICVMNVGVETDWLKTVQQSDVELQRIANILNDPNTKEVVEIQSNFTIKNNILYRIVKKDNEITLLWVVPKSVRWQVVRMNHDDLGHFGFEKTYDRVRRVYWFAKMRRFIKKYCKACLHCSHNKVPAGPKEGMLHPIPKPDKPFDTLHADHCGPFPLSKKGNSYILAIIDSFSKFIYIKAVKNCKTKTTIAVFEEYFSLLGVPRRLITDRGTSFTSHAFGTFVKDNGITHILNAVATPRANGQIERYNRTIVDAITASNHGRADNEWDTVIPKVQWGLNNTLNKGIGKTPAEILFGVNPIGQCDGIMNAAVSETRTLGDRNVIRNEASDRIKEGQQKNKERFDKKRKGAKQYKVGDLVRVERELPGLPGQSKKLLPKCCGPYRVSKVLGNDRYEVVDTPITKREGKTSYKNVFAVDKIHPWLVYANDPVATDSDSDTVNDA